MELPHTGLKRTGIVSATWLTRWLQWTGGILLVVIATIVWGYPLGKGWLLYLSGTQIVDTATNHPVDYAQLSRAQELLEQAVRLQPDNVNIYIALSRLHLLQKQPVAALARLEHAYQLAPDHLPIQYEIAHAHEVSGHTSEAAQIWRALGYDSWHMVIRAQHFLHQFDWSSAEIWYHRAILLYPELRNDFIVPYAIAAAGNNSSEATELLNEAVRNVGLRVYEVGSDQPIPGGELRWLNPRPEWNIYFGTPLSVGSAEPSIGIFPWEGWGVAVIKIDRSGSYQLRLRLQHVNPPPARMQYGINGQMVGAVSLERGDGSWETLHHVVELPTGYQVITLGFLNDGLVNGLDRNGAVAWIELRPNEP